MLRFCVWHFRFYGVWVLSWILLKYLHSNHVPEFAVYYSLHKFRTFKGMTLRNPKGALGLARLSQDFVVVGREPGEGWPDPPVESSHDISMSSCPHLYLMQKRKVGIGVWASIIEDNYFPISTDIWFQQIWMFNKLLLI